MTDHHSKIHKQIQALNETPLSQHVMRLFQQEKVEPESYLWVTALALWGWEQGMRAIKGTGHQPEEVDQSLINATQNSPEAVYENLAVPELMDAETLEEAAKMVWSELADLLPG